MAIHCNNISDLATLFRENGDEILDASSKLCLSTTILHNLNESLANILSEESSSASFNTIEKRDLVNNTTLSLHLLYDFIQKTRALKILPGPNFWNNRQLINIKLFKNLKLLEIQRLSLNFVQGIKQLRTQLEYLTCMHSLNTLRDVLENCGADKSQGFVWKELKEAVFSYNGLDSLDNSLEFAPWLHSLDLSHNRIQNAQLLNCLPNLQYLNLSYNQLEGIPAFTGQLRTSLKVLVLQNNFIDDLQELSELVNLCKLDLSFNSLIEPSALTPLTHLASLLQLCVKGNPLSCHPRYRNFTASYLHINAHAIEFILDDTILSKAEKKLVGSMCPVKLPSVGTRSHLDSACSSESETTVIAAERYFLKMPLNQDGTHTSDMDTSTSSAMSVESIQVKDKQREETETYCRNKVDRKIVTVLQDCIGMHDSGIGRRPTSPCGNSIGSAASLDSAVGENLDNYSKQCDSDIEVISNPSQSSIEVLGSGSEILRFERSTSYITKSDLKTVGVEHHRSV